jgi:hypothetical protein
LPAFQCRFVDGLLKTSVEFSDESIPSGSLFTGSDIMGRVQAVVTDYIQSTFDLSLFRFVPAFAVESDKRVQEWIQSTCSPPVLFSKVEELLEHAPQDPVRENRFQLVSP